MAKNKTAFFVIAALAVGLIVFANAQPAPSGPPVSLPDASQPSTGFATEVSNQQFGLTEQQEGFVGHPYADGAPGGGPQMYSIGYGHQIQPGEQYLMAFTKSNPLPEPQAAQILMQDLQNIVDAINNTGVQFSQGQLDAATDLGMSGVGAALDLVNQFNQGGAAQVAAWLPTAYISWHPSPGSASQINQTLVNRRQQELQTWNAGSGLS